MHFLLKFLSRIQRLDLEDNIFYNINFPNKKIKNINGFKVVRPGERKPGELSKIIKGKSNNYFFWFHQKKNS